MAEEKKVEAEILDVRKVPSTDPGRLGKFDILVTYRIGPAQVYMIRVAEEEFTEEQVTEAIKKDIEEKKRWIGRKITI